jgi:hypothetical protein
MNLRPGWPSWILKCSKNLTRRQEECVSCEYPNTYGCFEILYFLFFSQSKFAFGHNFYHPHETFHEPSRKFFPNEVFRMPLYEMIPLETIIGSCCVMDKLTSLLEDVKMNLRPGWPSWILKCSKNLTRRQEECVSCEYSKQKTWWHLNHNLNYP